MTVNVALVGLGNIGRKEIRELQSHPDFTVRAVCDRLEDRRRAIETRFDVPAFETLEETLAAVDVNLVRITTEPQTHHELAIEALEAGIDVYLEKIMTPTVAEAEDIVETAREHGQQTYVRRNAIYTPVYLRTKARLSEIGEVRRVEWVEPVDSYDSYDSYKQQWLRDLPGGAISEHLPHALYLIRWFLDAEPTVVNATSTEQELYVDLKAGGKRAAISYVPPCDTPMLLTIVGTEGTLIVDHDTMRIARPKRHTADSIKERVVRSNLYDLRQWAGHVTSLGARYSSQALWKLLGSRRGWADQHTDHYRQFDDIVHGSEFDISGMDGLKNVRLFESIWETAAGTETAADAETAAETETAAQADTADDS